MEIRSTLTGLLLKGFVTSHRLLPWNAQYKGRLNAILRNICLTPTLKKQRYALPL